MLEYIKNLFKAEYEEEEVRYSRSEDKNEPALDISEPIISFVEIFKDNPRRFKLEEVSIETPEGYYSAHYQTSTYILEDKIAKLRYKVGIDISPYTKDILRVYGNYCGMGGQDVDWITEDEWSYITHNIVTYYQERADRLKQRTEELNIKHDIRTRNEGIEIRNKFKEIYNVNNTKETI